MKFLIVEVRSLILLRSRRSLCSVSNGKDIRQMEELLLVELLEDEFGFVQEEVKVQGVLLH